MKKLLSALMAFTMIATTFVSSAFAAGVNVELKSDASAAGVNAGDQVIVSMELKGDQAFANFELGIQFEKDVFELVKAAKTKKTDWSGTLVMPNVEAANSKGIAKTTFAGDSNNGFDDDEWYQVDYTFAVKAGAKGGSYDFTSVAVGAMKDQKGVEISPVCGSTTVLVNGAVEEEVKTAIDGKYPEVTKDGIKAIGTSGTITVPDGKSFSKIDFTFENSKGETGSYTWDFGTSISATTTYGLNIYNVPADVTSITCTSAEAK